MLTNNRRLFAGFAWLVCSGLAISSCGARSELPYPALDVCVSFEASAERTQVDLFILLDSSGSMEFVTNKDKTKWSEVVGALSHFLVDPALADTGAGVAFFPEVRPEVPTYCYSDDTCGEPDSCMPFGICWPTGGTPCLTDIHCAEADLVDDVCEPMGLCEGDPEWPCILSDADSCGGLGPCVDGGLCTNTASCDPASYAVEEVIALPEGASTLIAAMNTRILDGSTPTWPALRGAIKSAVDWSKANPAHKSIVVLATDGLPTACDPEVDPFAWGGNIGKVPNAAAAGYAEGVETFVVGVFAPDEEEAAQVNLDTVAAAGGTGKAFVVTTDQSVEKEFLAALEDVREAASRCVYTAEWFGSSALSLAQVRVGLNMPNGQQIMVDPRANRDGCHPALGGFYFEATPTEDSNTVRIALCEASCLQLGGKPQSIDLLVSCE